MLALFPPKIEEPEDPTEQWKENIRNMAAATNNARKGDDSGGDDEPEVGGGILYKLAEHSACSLKFDKPHVY